MSQYLTEVIGRFSVGGLIALLVLLVACLIISSVRKKKAAPVAQAETKSMKCPMCGGAK